MKLLLPQTKNFCWKMRLKIQLPEPENVKKIKSLVWPVVLTSNLYPMLSILIFPWTQTLTFIELAELLVARIRVSFFLNWCNANPYQSQNQTRDPTPPRTPRISGLKSQVLKPTFLS